MLATLMAAAYYADAAAMLDATLRAAVFSLMLPPVFTPLDRLNIIFVTRMPYAVISASAIFSCRC